MSLSIQKLSSQLSTLLFSNTDTTTVLNAISADTYSNTHIDAIQINNEENTHAVWLKIYNTGTPTLGTTQTHMKFKCPAQKTVQFSLSGLAMGTMCFVVTKEANYTKSTDPDNGAGVFIFAH